MELISGKIMGAQKVVVTGPEGIGKSIFASQFPNTIFIDTEDSTKHLDVIRTPKPSSWAMLLEQVKHFIKNPRLLSTLAVDTADWAEKLCILETCAKNGKSGIEDFGYGKGPVYVAEEFGKLLNLLTELIDKNVNVVLTAHVSIGKFDLPEETGSYNRWEMKLTKHVRPLVKEWADMILFANYKTFVVQTGEGMNKKNKAQGGKRVMYTSHHPCWDAKNRHDLAPELPFDFAEIAHCIPVKAGKQAPVHVEPPKVEPPVQTTIIKEEPPKPAPEPPKQEVTGIPKPLADLMAENKVTIEEIQQAVSSKGYYPKNTPIENYDPDFINGVLVGAWAQVFQIIQAFRDDLPF